VARLSRLTLSKALPRKKGRCWLTLSLKESWSLIWAVDASVAVKVLLIEPISNSVSWLMACLSYFDATP
jgi:hypothetical protein